jgi:hypothetical protein
MKTPISIRVAALIAAAATTFVLVLSIARLGLPAPDAAPQLAEFTAPVTPS